MNIIKFSLLLICTSAFGQSSTKYASKADSLFEFEYFEEAVNEYSQIFLLQNTLIDNSSCIKAACCLSQLGEIDSSYFYLNFLANEKKYIYSLELILEPYLFPIIQDKRWTEIINKINQNKFEFIVNNNLNQELIRLLDTVHYYDQIFRIQMELAQSDPNSTADKINKIGRNILHFDSLNTITISNLLEKIGWPDTNEIDSYSSKTIFLALQHSDINSQIKFLPNIKRAAKKGYIESKFLAIFKDRIAISKNKNQIYVSQIGYNNINNTYFVFPLKCPKNVNKRRLKIGLNTIEDYLMDWGMKWDAKDYKRNLPKIKEYLKNQKAVFNQ